MNYEIENELKFLNMSIKIIYTVEKIFFYYNDIIKNA
jgi:hypothetical protein